AFFADEGFGGEDFSGELIGGTDVDEVELRRADVFQDFIAVSADGFIAGGDGIIAPLHLRPIGRPRPAFLFPLDPPAVHQAGVLVAVVLELPQGPRGEPVVHVAVEDDRVVRLDSRLARQLGEGFGVDQVADRRVAQIGGPVPADGVLDVSDVVPFGGLDIDLDDLDLRVIGVLGDPAGGD